MIIVMEGTSLRRIKPVLSSVNSCLFATNMEVMHGSRSVHVNAKI